MAYQFTHNYTMLCDFYEFTMSNGYFQNGLGERTVYFDMFFRKVPDGGGFAIACGLHSVIDYMEKLRFSEDDIAYLRGKGCFSEGFLDYLANFKFSCDVWAVPEGTPVFPGEPLLTVRGPAIQAQLLETMVLLSINHQSLIATKASRIVRAAGGRPVMEFGSRRAQGAGAAIEGSRASYIAGCVGSACALTEPLYGVPALGTMAHAWVQMFDSELEAFRAYARDYPESCTLLVDTYNVLKSGVPNAIRVFNEEILPRGFRPAGIRIDSGDITYLSKKARRMLDEAGFADCKICASNSLDEYIIRDTIVQGAAIDSFGVGERMITSKSDPVFGGVYKLVAVEKDGEIIPKIKISENVQKITLPHFKKVYRLYERESDKAIADVICCADETIEEGEPYLLFDPEHTWKHKRVEDFKAEPLLRRIYEDGKLVYDRPETAEVRAHCAKELDRLWDEVKRFENPHRYYVDLSQKLWDLRAKLLADYTVD